ncbi:MAG: hypothetical protein KF832_03160 [Caldilineaceae bacterium]|nr:hypothetical protein [Caldilineaceae bacterium]
MSENGTQPIHVLLSREELLLILQQLQASGLAGLDDDPAGELTAEQQTLALRVAERALRARELAQLRPNGELAIHTALLAAVAVCAYPQQTLFAYHWPDSGSDAMVRYFGYGRQQELVAHSRPADVLHLFTRFADPVPLVAQVLALCGWEESPVANFLPFPVAPALFGEVRQWASAGNVTGALERLRTQRIPIESARAFVMTLAEGPRLSIIQMRKQENGGVSAQDVTLVQNSQRSWLVRPTAGNPDSLTIQPTTRVEVERLLAGWLK